MPYKDLKKKQEYQQHYQQRYYHSDLKTWRQNHLEHGLLSHARSRAKCLGLPCSITVTDIVIPAICPVLGIPILSVGKRSDNSPSLDRVDPSVGYVPGNVQVISFRANRIKNNGTAKEHRQIADWIEKILGDRNG